MKTRLLKIAAAIFGGIILLLALLLLAGPFLVTVEPLEGLTTPGEAASDDSRFITIPFEGTDGIDIHYLEEGANTGSQPYTFLLLHGSNFNAYTWNEVLDFFGDYGYAAAYDQIPYGLSEKLLEGDWTQANPYTASSSVKQLFLFMDEMEIDSAVLVGNSYGAVLAVQAALSNPERVEALILADPAVYVEEEMPAWLLESPQMQRVGPLFARQLGQNEAFIRQTYADPESIDEERMQWTIIQTRVEDWDYVYWEYLRAWGAETSDYRDDLSRIQQPSLVLSGDSDRIVPLEDSERLAAELPNASLVVLPDCGHVPQEECPTAFEDAVSAWLADME